MVVSVIVIVILALAFLIPQGAATIPLNVSYVVGEKMVYSITETESSVGSVSYTGALNPTKFNSTETQTVIGFNGQTYSINHTQSLGAFSISYIEEVNQTGYSEDIYPQSSSTEAANVSNVNPVLVFLAMPEVKVGDTEIVSLDSNSSSSSSTGNMTLTFVDIQNITVPSGTYKVFRVDSSSKDMVTITRMNIPWSNSSQTLMMNLSVNETDYVEYDTGHLIESNIDFVTQPQFSNATVNVTGTTQLIEDIIPSQTSVPSTTPSASAAGSVGVSAERCRAILFYLPSLLSPHSKA